MSASATRVTPELLQQIANAIGSMRYGCVQITVHEARVVQIEKVERVRLTNPPSDRTPGGFRHNSGP